MALHHRAMQADPQCRRVDNEKRNLDEWLALRQVTRIGDDPKDEDERRQNKEHPADNAQEGFDAAPPIGPAEAGEIDKIVGIAVGHGAHARHSAGQSVKIFLGIMAWMPLTPSTTCVTS